VALCWGKLGTFEFQGECGQDSVGVWKLPWKSHLCCATQKTRSAPLLAPMQVGITKWRHPYTHPVAPRWCPSMVSQVKTCYQATWQPAGGAPTHHPHCSSTRGWGLHPTSQIIHAAPRQHRAGVPRFWIGPVEGLGTGGTPGTPGAPASNTVGGQPTTFPGQHHPLVTPPPCCGNQLQVLGGTPGCGQPTCMAGGCLHGDPSWLAAMCMGHTFPRQHHPLVTSPHWCGNLLQVPQCAPECGQPSPLAWLGAACTLAQGSCTPWHHATASMHWGCLAPQTLGPLKVPLIFCLWSKSQGVCLGGCP
jgi:hypothetical protein